MQSPHLRLLQIAYASAVLWTLAWNVILKPSVLFSWYISLIWLLPLLWLQWWGRKGHYKPIFLSALAAIAGSIAVMSYLADDEWPYALIALTLWLLAFYSSCRHLQAIKNAIARPPTPSDKP